MAKILVVDDERRILDVLAYSLKREGFEVEMASDGKQALEAFVRISPDLVVLDILMPELDGIEVCREIRKTSDTPIIFLSSKTEEIDRILGLELGGDDYVTKPFSPRELAVRVKTVLRRAGSSAARPAESHEEPSEQRIVHGPIVVDPARHEVTVDGNHVVLTVTEFEILRALLRRPGVVLTRGQLIEQVYGDGYHVSERSVDTHVRRIRSKMRRAGLDPIETVHGLGYKATRP